MVIFNFYGYSSCIRRTSLSLFNKIAFNLEDGFYLAVEATASQDKMVLFDVDHHGGL